MSEPRRALTTVLLLCFLLPGISRAAQEPGSEQVLPDAVTAPPLVPAEPAPAIDESLEAPVPEVQEGSSVPLLVRGLAEMVGGGLSGATVGFLAAVVLPGITGCDNDGCIAPIVLGGIGGAALGLPLGVYGAGRLLGVRGGLGALGASYLGMGIGGGAGLVSALIAADEDGVSFIAVPVGAVLGAIIGFELGADSPSEAAPRAGPRKGAGPTLLLAPIAGPAPRGGGFMGGLSGRF